MMHAAVFVSGLAIGALAGAGFFAGLWWTTQKLPGTSRPARLLAASLVLRFGLLLAVFVVAAGLDPVLLIGVLTGTVATRVVLTRPGVMDRLPQPLSDGADHG